MILIDILVMSTSKKKWIPNVVLILVIVVGICWVASRFIHLGRVEYTNNAQVKQHITPVNTRVQGFIKKIYFEEYQRVCKGDTLVVIEEPSFVCDWPRRRRITGTRWSGWTRCTRRFTRRRVMCW